MSYKGKLLVAHPNLKDNSFFEKSVIYIFEHNIQGAQGIIINKATEYAVESIVQQRGLPYLSNEQVYKGGPLNTRAISILHTDDWYSSNTITCNAFGLSSDDFMLQKLSMGNEPRNWRMFAGMCGWGPRQLETEIDGNTRYSKSQGWLVLDATEHVMFDFDGDEQWVRAVDQCSKQVINKFF